MTNNTKNKTTFTKTHKQALSQKLLIQPYFATFLISKRINLKEKSISNKRKKDLNQSEWVSRQVEKCKQTMGVYYCSTYEH